MSSQPAIRAFFDAPTNTISYLLADPATGAAAIIDPVLDFDAASGTVDVRSAQALLAAAAREGWRIGLILETHAHADHLSAAPWLRQATGAPVGIGSRITEVQSVFAPRFAAGDIRPDGADFDLLLRDGDELALGELTIEVLHTPGHTPACASYRVGDAVFVGDTLFMPDYGTARCDFPGGDARTLYRSIRRLLALPGETRMFLCHDYKAPGRDQFAWETTVAEQRRANIHVHDGVDEDAFVAMREARDATLAAPRLLLPSIQVNIRAGRFPPADPDGAVRLRLPVSARSPEAAAALG
jgi:glyoxylase-like metal-dependent hydrolase (beta-lactamase superfamily II)